MQAEIDAALSIEPTPIPNGELLNLNRSKVGTSSCSEFLRAGRNNRSAFRQNAKRLNAEREERLNEEREARKLRDAEVRAEAERRQKQLQDRNRIRIDLYSK